jgi:hypothetical protein
MSPAALHDLHVQAVALIRAKDYARGGTLLHRVYQQTPVERRSRALIINHAILDLVQRIDVGRAVHDLAAYLTASDEPDEVAIDVLGASLNLMAERYKGKLNPAWQSAMQVWDQKDAQLEQTRPGMHHWGTQWLDEEKFAWIQAGRDHAARQLIDQRKIVAKAHSDLELTQQHIAELAALQPAYSGVTPDAAAGGAAINGTPQTVINLPGKPPVVVVGPDPNNGTDLNNVGAPDPQTQARQMAREDLPAKRQALAAAQARLVELENSQPRPDWPTRFDPVDPGASEEPFVPAIASRSKSATQPGAGTRPTSNDPLSRAIALMQDGDLKKARAALDAIWKATPPEQRSRTLALNRAIATFPDPRLAMSAVRDLSEYLAARGGSADELATNILGSALNEAANQGDRIKEGAVWQAAYKEWARRNDLMDHSRPGFRRWGPQWLSDDEFAQLRQRQRDLEARIADQRRIVDQTLRQIGDIRAAASIQEYIDEPTNLFDPNTNRAYLRSQLTPDQLAQAQAAHDYRLQRQKWQNLNRFYELHAQEIDANAQLQQDLAGLDTLLSQRERPQWPLKYDSVPAE